MLIVEFETSYAERFEGTSGMLSERAIRQDAELKAVFNRLHNELLAPDATTPIACEALLLECLAYFARLRMPARDKAPAWLPRLEERLRFQGVGLPSLAELAADAQLNPSHLARSFRQHHGMSIGSYRRTKMVEAARDRIASTNDSLVAIAQDLGFSDQSHMSRLFRKILGRTPGQFRR